MQLVLWIFSKLWFHNNLTTLLFSLLRLFIICHKKNWILSTWLTNLLFLIHIWLFLRNVYLCSSFLLKRNQRWYLLPPTSSFFFRMKMCQSIKYNYTASQSTTFKYQNVIKTSIHNNTGFVLEFCRNFYGLIRAA